MRNLLLTVFLVSAFTTGCKKEETSQPATPKRCYECEIIKSIKRNDGMAASYATSKQQYCDQTAESIKAIEKSGTYTRNEVEYTQTILVTLKTTCK